MEVFHQSMLFLHILGLSAIIGGFFVQLRQRPPKVSQAMLLGAGLQVLTGLLLVFALERLEDTVDRPKIFAKLTIALAVAVTARLGTRRPETVALYWATGLLAIVNVGVAIFW